MPEETKQAGTIDLTPTWASLVMQLAEVAVNGQSAGRADARIELMRMARIADGTRPLIDGINAVVAELQDRPDRNIHEDACLLLVSSALGQFGVIVQPKT